MKKENVNPVYLIEILTSDAKGWLGEGDNVIDNKLDGRGFKYSFLAHNHMGDLGYKTNEYLVRVFYVPADHTIPA